MALQLDKLCRDSDYLYGMRVLSGISGMKNIVQWVHTIEDVQVGEFLHGGELIFTTGIARQEPSWLLPFIRQLVEKGAAGLVINVGPYIEQVPQEVIDYCMECHFPLLEVPWKTRLVDMTRDFCNQIIEEEQRQLALGEALHGIISQKENESLELEQLREYGYRMDDQYCMVVLQEQQKTTFKQREKEYDRLAAHLSQDGVLLLKEEYPVFVFHNCSEEGLDQDLDYLKELCHNKHISIGVGPCVCQLNILSGCYKKAVRLARLAKNRGLCCCRYDDLEMERLLVSVDNDEVFECSTTHLLEQLEEYDRKHDTAYLVLLRKYIEYDGSILRISRETNQHRNTINYQIGKIKTMIQMDLTTLEEKLKLLLAFKIRDISQ